MTGRMLRGVPAVVAALLVAGCRGESPPEVGMAADTAGTIAPDRPLLPPGSVSLTERLRLSGAPLERPLDVAADGAGSIYVLDAGTRILKFDSAGAFVLRFGTRDTVRERIAAAVEIDLAQWNIVMLADRGDNAVKTFLTGGLFASAAPLRPGVALDVHALPEFGEFYLHKWVPEQRRSAVIHMRAPLDSLAATYAVRIPQGLDVRAEARAVHFLSTADRRGRLYVAFLDGYPVRVLSAQGATLATIEIERAPIRRSPEQIEVEAERNLAALRERAPEVDEGVLLEAARPDSLLPIIEELAVDPQGRLWVRTNRPDAEGVTPYDVFNSEGDYLARVDVPGDVSRTAFSPGGELWVVVGEEEVVAYRVTVEAGR